MEYEAASFRNRVQLGEPHEHRGLAVYPLFPRQTPGAHYITLDEALVLGFRITEVDEAGSVPELRAENPLEVAVLLYDGEELIGAKQNRILDVSVLVPARSSVTIPVSCVEQGRWRYARADFAAASHAAHPELRRRKAQRLATSPAASGAAQGEVWASVSDTQARLGTHSETEAQADIFTQHETDLRALRGAFPLEPGQAGAILALSKNDLCLDYVSRPEAFARLYPKLLGGYLLDAVGRLDGQPADTTRIEVFIDSIASAPRRAGASPGLGEDVRLAAEGIVGSGLTLGGELLQLSAYTTRERDSSAATTIADPRRRRAP